MATKLELVLQGARSLSNEDRAKLIRLLNERATKGVLAEDALAKSLHVSMGPLDTSCPCCGR